MDLEMKKKLTFEMRDRKKLPYRQTGGRSGRLVIALLSRTI